MCSYISQVKETAYEKQEVINYSNNIGSSLNVTLGRGNLKNESIQEIFTTLQESDIPYNTPSRSIVWMLFDPIKYTDRISSMDKYSIISMLPKLTV